jgi:predicted PurR-regulated permease PerM
MLGFDRSAARFVWTAALVVLMLYAAFLMRKTVFIFILALLFAYLVAPLVNALDRALPTRTHTAALALAYVIFVGAVGTAGFEIGSRAVEQAARLSKELPAKFETWKAPPEGRAPTTIERYRAQILDKVQSEVSTRASTWISALPETTSKFLSIASDLIYVVIIPILAFFILKDGSAIRTNVLELLDTGPHRMLLDEILGDLDTLLAHYMRALVVLALAAFAAYSIFFSILGVPYAILLAAFGGMLEFLPMIGPVASGVTIVLVAVVSGTHPLAVLIFVVVFRVVQDYGLSPHLMGQGAELHPLLVLFGVFAGAEVAGVPGAFLSVPLLALVRILFLRIRRSRVRTAFDAPLVVDPQA